MFKKMFIAMLSLAFAIVLVSCDTTEPSTPLTSITFEGLESVTLEFEEEFNVLEGVRAKGNNGQYYDELITYSSVAEIDENDMLDTTVPGTKSIFYTVTVPREGTTALVKQGNRFITVNPPQVQDGEYLVNGDFSQGTTGWDKFEDNGGTMQLSVANNVLTAVVVAGPNAWEPRLSQMNVPFVLNETYTITYEAKSSVDKPINVQAGKILANDPWFIDYDHKLVVHNLTTEWDTYSWTFTHTTEGDGGLGGGIIFEFGTVASQKVNATIEMRNITISLFDPEAEDTTAPSFTGVVPTITVPTTVQYDPLQGVTAFDDVDGDVTDQIEVVIKNSSNDVVDSVNTAVAGTYTVTYTVEDEAGNSKSASTAVTVQQYNFSNNLLSDSDFSSDPLAGETDWTLFLATWGWVGQGTMSYDADKDAIKLVVSQPGETGYFVKMIHKDVTFEQGKTYLVEFEWSGSIARPFTLAVGYNDPGDPNIYYSYAANKQFSLGTTTTYGWYMFTVELGTSNVVEIGFEFGGINGLPPEALNGIFYLESISLREVL